MCVEDIKRKKEKELTLLKGREKWKEFNPLSAQMNPECVPRLPVKMCIIYWLDINSNHDHFSDKIEYVGK